MENAAEALKIAFAVMLFVIALTLSMSSFSQATRAVNVITSMRDRENGWVGDLMYVTPSKNLTRTVGIETVVTSIYRAYEENMIIYFFENDGTTPMILYNKVDDRGNIIGEVSSIDLSNETFGAQQEPKEFLDIILGGNDGLYNKLKDTQFEEKLGEYKDTTGLTKRVITYTKK